MFQQSGTSVHNILWLFCPFDRIGLIRVINLCGRGYKKRFSNVVVTIMVFCQISSHGKRKK